jgi:hypothetical protein
VSEDKREKLDIRDVLKPWHDTIRTVYYIVAILVTVYFALAGLLSHVVVPYGKQVDAALSLFIFLLLAFLHNRLSKKRLTYDQNHIRSFIITAPFLFTCLAFHAGTRYYVEPSIEPHFLWGILFGMAIVTVPISLMDATICLISQLEAAIIGLLHTIVKHQQHAHKLTSDEIGRIINHLVESQELVGQIRNVLQGGQTPQVPPDLLE